MAAPVVTSQTSQTSPTFAKQRRREVLEAYLFIAPALLIIAVFVIYPAFRSLWLSFHEQIPFIGRLDFVGWQNYRNMFTGSFASSYRNSVRVTAWFTLFTVPSTVVLGLLIALLINRDLPGMALFRSLIFVTVSVSTAVAAVAWGWLFNTQIGFINYLLSFVGVPRIAWLTNPRVALFAIAVITIWQSLGFTAILLLSGLQTISQDCLEVACIDGANALQKLLYVTLPLLSPTLFIVTVLSVINSLTAFGQVHILTRGGPGEATNLLVYNLYRDGFQNFRPGFASAQAFVLFIALGFITLLQFRVLGKRIHYQ